MRISWLNKKNNKRLIVFFNGWGFDENVVKKLDFNEFDIVVMSDYRDLNPISYDFTLYEERYLVAWSLGVYVCNFYYDIFNDFDGFTAINGTQKPIDDEFGIPVNAYNLTVDNFNELTCSKFVKKIGSESDVCRSIEELKQELINIRDLKPKQFLKFDKAIVSTKDRIFPHKNMLEFWKKEGVKISEIEAPHYIFNLYDSWSDLV